MYPQSMFGAKIKIISQYLKIIIFTAVKYHSILHMRVCVMRLICFMDLIIAYFNCIRDLFYYCILWIYIILLFQV